MTDVTKTIATYNKQAAIFSDYFEKSLNYPELEFFMSHLPPQAYILDVGCGSGKDSAYFTKKGFSTLGIDLSEKLLEEAKRRHPELKVELMDMRKLELADEAFDGVWAHASLLHLDRTDVPTTLQEFYRVLKPGGLFYAFVKEGTGEKSIALDTDAQAERDFTFFNEDEMKKYAESASFEIIKSYTFNNSERGSDHRDIDWVVIFAKKPSH